MTTSKKSPLSPRSWQGTFFPQRSWHADGSIGAEWSPTHSIPASEAPAPTANAAEKHMRLNDSKQDGSSSPAFLFNHTSP